MIKTKLIALVTILTAFACATSPTGRRQLMLVSESTAIAASKQAYLQQIEELEKENKLGADPELERWVERITERLVAQAIRERPATRNWEWSVAIIDEPDTVNAWAMAGGRMAVYTGLIRKLDPTEDEFAQVMGHEIAHALANHTAERMSVAMATQLGVVAVGAATDSDVTANTAALAAALAINLPNSRTAESEADRIGIELAARAGYDPNAALTLWQKMNNAGGRRPPQFLSTHPDPANRQETLRGLVPQMMPLYRAADTPPSHPVRIVD